MIYKQTCRHISYILGSSEILKGLALVRGKPGWSRAQGYLNNSLQQQIDHPASDPSFSFTTAMAKHCNSLHGKRIFVQR